MVEAAEPTVKPPDWPKLIAVVYADMVGYSRLIGLDDIGTLERLRTLRTNVVDPAIAQYGGRIVQTGGDSLLIVFDSIEGALRCAMTVQRRIPSHDRQDASDRRMRFRMGIDIGDAIADGTDLHGDGVIVAARLQAECPAGGVCVSRAVRDHVHDRLDLTFEAMGLLSLKNIARPVEAFLVRSPEALKSTERTQVHNTGDHLALPDKPSLAVLPFHNMSGDPEQEYFADGVVEEITTAIARFPWLFVIARNSSFTYKGKAVDVRQVARELGVRYVLEGSVRKAGNRVRITGQLIDAATGTHLWADRFDGGLEDIFELQDQVASRVVGAIEPRLRLSEGDRVSRKPTENLDAYDLYLRARAQSYKRTEESVAEALRLARRALELDPAFAPTMARIARARQIQRLRHWIPELGEEVEEGIQMARQALAVARDNPEVLRLAGFVLAALAGENGTGLAAIDRAIELNPNYALAHAERGLVLTWLNRPDEAITAAEQAIRLSPHDPTIHNFYPALCTAHLASGRYEEALLWADRALGRNGGLPALRQKLSLCGHLGRREETDECLQRLRETYPEPTVAAVMRAVPKGMSPELAARIAEGLRHAGLPEG